MCGIAGIADRRGIGPDDRRLIDAMLLSLAHRGPDDHASHAEDGAVLGARRLSIIDIARGRQPVTNEDGTIIAVQNGELYNFVELREQLLAGGHTLRSDGDTETIVHLYEDYGDRLVDHLRGMYALAVWDARRGHLLLARDRLGKKPLYWRHHAGRLTFGSELKALLADPALAAEVDEQALTSFLAYQYVPAPASILRGVQKLPPASTLVWDGGEPKVERYWWPAYEPKSARAFEEDRDECIEILREAVRIRLRSDVPVGAFLSGGIDSALVTGLMAELSDKPVRTFTIGFTEPRLDERAHAEAVARVFATQHTSVVVDLDAIDLLPRLAQAYDEPFGDPSAIPTLRVAHVAAQDLKVVLTGDGGDELFGGYERYRRDAELERWRRRFGPFARPGASLARRLLGVAAPRAKLTRQAGTVARVIGLEPDERYEELMRIMPPRLVADLLGGTPPTDGYLRQPLPGVEPSARLDRLLRLDTLTYLPEDLLVKLDRATMAYSLEARSPLLDQELVAFAARLPVTRKRQAGDGKVLLRSIAAKMLPEAIVNRPKKGFSVPIDAWFRGPLGNRFEEIGLAPDSYLREIVDLGVAARLLSAHRLGAVDAGHQLWLLLVLELWGRSWGRRIPTPLGTSPAAVVH